MTIAAKGTQQFLASTYVPLLSMERYSHKNWRVHIIPAACRQWWADSTALVYSFLKKEYLVDLDVQRCK